MIATIVLASSIAAMNCNQEATPVQQDVQTAVLEVHAERGNWLIYLRSKDSEFMESHRGSAVASHMDSWFGRKGYRVLYVIIVHTKLGLSGADVPLMQQFMKHVASNRLHVYNYSASGHIDIQYPEYLKLRSPWLTNQ